MAFILGALSIFALRYARLWPAAHLVKSHAAWVANGEYALFVVGVPEESIKVAVIAAIAWWSKAFNEPMDGVVYGAAVGLGFAAQENLGYLAGFPDWHALAIVRGILTIPFHAAPGSTS